MDEPEWVLLSEIEHWAYCPRQWAIIHLEQHFADNDDTTRGHLAHDRVDRDGHETRGDTTTFWALDVSSDQHHLRGRCDRVIRHGDQYIPIEHKSGRRALDAATLQLVAQAVCLEEMLSRPVPEGRIYLHASNTTLEVDTQNPDLRERVLATATAIRNARQYQHQMPDPANDRRCGSCSLDEACLPAVVASTQRQRGLHGATWWP
jgi:CRISPR-associated exonuclease Cas4